MTDSCASLTLVSVFSVRFFVTAAYSCSSLSSHRGLALTCGCVFRFDGVDHALGSGEGVTSEVFFVKFF